MFNTKIEKMKKILVLLLLSVGVLNAQTERIWDYPIRPGSEEWAALSSHKDMLKVCQIPDDYLKTMATKDLIITCLNYPLKVDFYVYNSLHEGLIKVAAKFNGLQELFKREDNAVCLFDMWERANAETLSDKLQYQQGELVVKQSLIEAFLAHEHVLANATLEQQKIIATIAFKNMEHKEKQPHLFSRYSLGASAYLLCAILKRMNDRTALSAELELFLETGTLHNSAQIEKLKQNYYKLLTN